MSVNHIAGIIVSHLRCEYMVNPTGIDVISPRLSWILLSEGCCVKQTAYRILVSGSESKLGMDIGDLWDSGKVQGDDMSHIEYKGMMLASRVRCFWKVCIWDSDGNVSDWSEPAYWSMGLLLPEDWTAGWISCPERGSLSSSPMFRKEFTICSDIEKAVTYVTSRGLYELRINGARAGDHILSPEWTDYKKRLQYQSFDVTSLVRKGENAITAVLGEGWYAGEIQQWPPVKHAYGSEQELLLQLEVTTRDGPVVTIVSDETWKSTVDGPIRSSSIYEGETYDATKEMKGWDSPGFVSTGWGCVSARCGMEGSKLVWQKNEPIKVVDEINPVSVKEIHAGTWICDMGQNIAGWCRITVDEPKGTLITIKYNEMLNEDGSLYMNNLWAGHLSGNPRRQTDEYICGGNGCEAFEPHFTYHGFRYVEISGASHAITAESVKGAIIRSSLTDSGRFACSDITLNRIFRNALWTQYGNMYGIPTDCPQRDERMGWLGDIQVFCQSSIYNMDMAAFLCKVSEDIRDAQRSDGQFTDLAPYPEKCSLGLTGDPAWADAGIIIPWLMYLNYGDKRLLHEHFDSAARYIEYLRSFNSNMLGRGDHTFPCDWLNGDTIKCEGYPDKGATMPTSAFSAAFFAHSAEIMAKISQALGKRDDVMKYRKLYDEVKEAFNNNYIDNCGRMKGDTQGGYALALGFGLLPEALRTAASNYMAEAITAYDGRLSTGIQATNRLIAQLSENGYHKEACRLVMQRAFPSWGYMIDMGATTIWERWDGYVAGRGFADDGMNSFNHMAFGSVVEWFWQYLAGIRPDEGHPGYRRFTVKPEPCEGLTWVRGEYDSISGKITVEWKTGNGKFAIQVEIPANTSAIVVVPAGYADNVRMYPAGRTRLKGFENIPMDSLQEIMQNMTKSTGCTTHPEVENGMTVYNLESGRYFLLSNAISIIS